MDVFILLRETFISQVWKFLAQVGERENHHKVSESHKPKSVLFATKSKLRGVQENPSTLHYVLIYKGEAADTNITSPIPPSLMSIL